MVESIYLMPGMGANPKIFEFLDLPNQFQVKFLSWIPPRNNETRSLFQKNE